MNSLRRRPLMIPILAPLLACGGSHGGSPTTPTSANAASKCRTYATSRTTNQTVYGANGYTYVSTESQSCMFDKTAHVLQCSVALNDPVGCTTLTQSTTYATVADFVEEAEAPGRERFDTFETTYSGNGCAATDRHVYTFDAQKRPLRRQNDYIYGTGTSSHSTTFTGWDALGRPSQETWTTDTIGGCNGAPAAGTAATRYDDAARTAIWRGTSCSSNEDVWTRTYDADGNLVNDVLNGDFSYTRASTIRATARLCL